MFSVFFFAKLQGLFPFFQKKQKNTQEFHVFIVINVFKFQVKLPDSLETQLDRTHTHTHTETVGSRVDI